MDESGCEIAAMSPGGGGGASLCAEVVALCREADEEVHEAREDGVLHAQGQLGDVGRDVKDAAADRALLLRQLPRGGKVKGGALEVHDAGVRREVAQQRAEDVQVLLEDALRLGVRCRVLHTPLRVAPCARRGRWESITDVYRSAQHMVLTVEAEITENCTRCDAAAARTVLRTQ